MQHEELALRIVQDHNKLDRTFSDLESTLINLRNNGPAQEDHDLLEDARADLAFALEEMLEHFGIEEEAIFQQIRTSLPDMNTRLDALERGHEALCANITQLRKMVAAANAGLKSLDTAAALKTLSQVRRLLAEHNGAEVKLFLEALERLDEDGQRLLLENLETL